MNGFRKDALLRTLKEDYGITTMEQLYDAMRKLKKLDITQFVAAPQTKGLPQGVDVLQLRRRQSKRAVERGLHHNTVHAERSRDDE